MSIELATCHLLLGNVDAAQAALGLVHDAERLGEAAEFVLACTPRSLWLLSLDSPSHL